MSHVPVLDSQSLPQTSLNRSSYANVTRNQPIVPPCPTRNQAIVISAQGDLKLADYIIAIGNIVQPRNVHFASRISNDRICIYLSSVEHVNNVVENHKVIKIRDQELSIRRLLTPARRIILSNVDPAIPEQLLEQEIRRTGIEPVSRITCLRASYISEAYSHIMSFRRQFYMKPNDNLELPPSILVNHNDTTFRIFLSYDEITCFICKSQGHIAKQCPITKEHENEHNEHDSKSSHTDDVQNPSKAPEPYTNAVKGLVNENIVTGNEEIIPPAQMCTLEKPIKRTATTIDSLSTENIINLVDEVTPDMEESARSDSHFLTPSNVPNKTRYKKLKRSDSQSSNPPPITDKTASSSANNNQPKKLKRHESQTSEPPPLTEQLESARQFYEECIPPIPYEILVNYLENAFGNSDPLSLAKTYNLEIPKLTEGIRTIYQFLTHRSVKSRCTRICKKLTNQAYNEDESTDTDTSLVSSF